MKKAEILDYLDELVEVRKHFYEVQNEKNAEGIIFCSNENIQVFDGIHILAAAAGEILEKAEFPYADDLCLTHRYSFTYKNVEISQLDDDEGFPEVVWDE